MQQTPSSNRIHIAFFGNRNAGKSSLVNAIANQSVSVVSDVKGTTTDPVQKSMELLPLGPVLLIDTPGIDDSGTLGDMRVGRTYKILNKTDIAVLVVDMACGITPKDTALINLFKEKNIPYIIVYNKCDLSENALRSTNDICVSSVTGKNIDLLKEKLASLYTPKENPLVGDLVCAGDVVVLVTPIDSAAPKGRLILPQQQTIRDLLDNGATAFVTQETELEGTLNALKQKPAMVITDSQVFGSVSKIVPKDVPLTSFSILFARYKGLLKTAVDGAFLLDNIDDGANILICEGCTHHRQCDDIGTVKLPSWIRNYTKKEFSFSFTSGGDFPDDLSAYSLIVHCGGCMLNERELLYRQKCATDQNIPLTNYGILIAYMNGILKRSIEIFDM